MCWDLGRNNTSGHSVAEYSSLEHVGQCEQLQLTSLAMLSHIVCLHIGLHVRVLHVKEFVLFIITYRWSGLSRSRACPAPKDLVHLINGTPDTILNFSQVKRSMDVTEP